MDYIIDGTNGNLINKYKCCVVFHLHYEEYVYKYKKYIQNIPDYIDIIITYSNEKIYNNVINITSEIKNKIYYIKKENRGRDVSALLVAAREKVLEYDIICFVHDKKSKSEILQKDTEEWVYSLWENSLSSKAYIEGIISIFENDKSVGILTPPLYFGEQFSAEIIDQWGQNYELMKKLFLETGVKNIPSNKSWISAFGTVFWARTSAIRKLLSKNWHYDDFDEEPLANDGTISHAIERSLWFYAKDAGYECHSIMTKKYASYRMEKLQDAFLNTMKVINENLGCWNVSQVKDFENKKTTMKKFCHKYKKIYIYGAGLNGELCLNVLRILNINPEAFIVSSKGKELNQKQDIPIMQLDECKFDIQTGIILAVSEKYRNDILKLLLDRINKNDIYIYNE